MTLSPVHTQGPFLQVACTPPPRPVGGSFLCYHPAESPALSDTGQVPGDTQGVTRQQKEAPGLKAGVIVEGLLRAPVSVETAFRVRTSLSCTSERCQPVCVEGPAGDKLCGGGPPERCLSAGRHEPVPASGVGGLHAAQQGCFCGSGHSDVGVDPEREGTELVWDRRGGRRRG